MAEGFSFNHGAFAVVAPGSQESAEAQQTFGEVFATIVTHPAAEIDYSSTPPIVKLRHGTPEQNYLGLQALPVGEAEVMLSDRRRHIFVAHHGAPPASRRYFLTYFLAEEGVWRREGIGSSRRFPRRAMMSEAEQPSTPQTWVSRAEVTALWVATLAFRGELTGEEINPEDVEEL